MHTRALRRVLILLVVAVALAGCGSDGSDGSGPTEATDPGEGSAGDAADGTIAVRLEEVDGVFVEGFEVGLRFETTDGEVVDATLWSDVVTAQGSSEIDAYYDAVLEQPVPAGSVVVRAQVEVGIGPGPATPDLAGDLPCELTVEVPDGGRVEVEVSFASTGPDGTNCLRLVPSG